ASCRSGKIKTCGRRPPDHPRSTTFDNSSPQYTATQFQGELSWLGIRSSPAFVGEPECNGIIERFMRTLKEECLYVHRFQTLDEARAVIGAFIEKYNNEWLIQRHGYRTPAEVRRELTLMAA